ncbi:MAG: divalent-cation tolerance protein CutA [Acidobacteriota bacterium]
MAATGIIILTTVNASFDARALARELVESRLCACVNIIDRVTSIYRWKEGVEEDGEQLLVIKTIGDRIDELEEKLRELHPYELPEFVVIPLGRIPEEYRRWLAESSQEPSPSDLAIGSSS